MKEIYYRSVNKVIEPGTVYYTAAGKIIYT